MLDRLLAIIGLTAQRLIRALARGRLTPTVWYDRMAQLLTRGHAAAMMVGSGMPTLTPAQRKAVVAGVVGQLKYLDKFKVEIQSAEEFQKGWESRAALYAQSIKAPYWQGRTKMLPLPAMPGDGSTACRGRCGCSWDIEVLDADKGDYNATWVRGLSDSCQGCIQREIDWAPYEIRGSEVAL